MALDVGTPVEIKRGKFKGHAGQIVWVTDDRPRKAFATVTYPSGVTCDTAWMHLDAFEDITPNDPPATHQVTADAIKALDRDALLDLLVRSGAFSQKEGHLALSREDLVTAALVRHGYLVPTMAKPKKLPKPDTAHDPARYHGPRGDVVSQKATSMLNHYLANQAARSVVEQDKKGTTKGKGN